MKSKVYFIKTTEKDRQSRAEAFSKLLDKIEDFPVLKKDEIIPVKITIGDVNCIHNIDPELAKIAVSYIRNKKANPFLFDTNVLYRGARSNAVDHMTLAETKGFSYSNVKAPFIIADGILGYDGKDYKINFEKETKKIKIPSFVGVLDSLVVLSHATGHIISSYAGAIKNIGMGMACRPTKQIEHSSIKPSVASAKCTSCGCCIEICPANAIAFKNEKASIDQDICIGCGECLTVCNGAVSINWQDDPFVVSKRMVDVAKFVSSKFKNKYFITFAFDITKECDCMSSKTDKIICKDIGILASSDMLSVDKATIDMINKGEDILLKERNSEIHSKMMKYGHEKQLGNLEYELIEL